MVSYTLAAVCHHQHLSKEIVVEMVSWGIATPTGIRPERWWFDESEYDRIARAARLGQDLSINVPGAALALQLIEEVQLLRAGLREDSKNAQCKAMPIVEF